MSTQHLYPGDDAQVIEGAIDRLTETVERLIAVVEMAIMVINADNEPESPASEYS
jgi:hypothetical protein